MSKKKLLLFPNIPIYLSKYQFFPILTPFNSLEKSVDANQSVSKVINKIQSRAFNRSPVKLFKVIRITVNISSCSYVPFFCLNLYLLLVVQSTVNSFIVVEFFDVLRFHFQQQNSFHFLTLLLLDTWVESIFDMPSHIAI